MIFLEQESQITVDTLTPSAVPEMLHTASFGGVGKYLIDDALNKLFAEIVGDDMFQNHVETNPEWLEIKSSIKRKLTELKDRHDQTINVFISPLCLHLNQEMKRKTLEEEIANSELAAEMKIRSGCWIIGSPIWRRISDLLGTKIILLLNTVLRKMQKERITTIFMIRGIDEGSNLHNIIRSSFADINFIFFSSYPEAAVLQGAVIHGWYQVGF